MPANDEWTPYPHEETRVRLLWRKRLLLALLVGSLFLVWSMSLGVQTETSEELNIYGGDGSQIQVQKPDEPEEKRPAATVTLRPGETARLENDLTLNESSERQGDPSGASVPERPTGIPFGGILLLLLPFIAAVAAWRYLDEENTTTEANYGVYKGAMPFEMVTATHADHVLTSQVVERNPFGKGQTDYLRDAVEDPARQHEPAVARQDPAN